MDEDSTTMTKRKKSVLHEETKEKDISHAKGDFRKRFICLTEKAPLPFIQSYFLPSKMSFLRSQAAQE